MALPDACHAKALLCLLELPCSTHTGVNNACLSQPCLLTLCPAQATSHIILQVLQRARENLSSTASRLEMHYWRTCVLQALR